ncbi:hypothetical protein BMJ32_01265 [Sinorhizobium medicae]|nr:hypothetical protein BMJ35_17825 [Sinorhizobium medicae]PLU07819.1 hypothetical protein BMJ32_01265 [Sinorhizobium medicae]PLU25415.1 hypothetical protein BMJ31_10190 [Sinorhizobium medicae]PLU30389.1 hypothetical protein BMJ28_24420 [Sinorhizobium medicae]PLU47044.1 hypothetical protein BMJ25_17125 [Sinorhizobium medicae]
MLTLVATRGRDFPLSMVASLCCPLCGSRRLAVVFKPPSEGHTRRGAVQLPLKTQLTLRSRVEHFAQ